MPVVISKSLVTTSNVPSTFNVPKVVFPFSEFIATLFDEVRFETPTEPLFEVIVTFANSPVPTVKSPVVVNLASPVDFILVISAESELIVTPANSPVPSVNAPVVVKLASPVDFKLVISAEPELIVTPANSPVPSVNLPSFVILATFDTFNFPNVTSCADVISKSDNVASGATTTFPVEVIVAFPPTFMPVVISKSLVTTSNVPSTFNVPKVVFPFSEFIATLFDEVRFETSTEPLFEVIETFANSPVPSFKFSFVVKLAVPVALIFVISAESELIVTSLNSPVPNANAPIIVKLASPVDFKLVISAEPELIEISLNSPVPSFNASVVVKILVPVAVIFVISAESEVIVISLNSPVPSVNLPSFVILARFDTFKFPNVTSCADLISKSDNVTSGVTTTFPVEVIVAFPPTFIPVVISKSFERISNLPSTCTVAKVTSPKAFILASVFELKSVTLTEPSNDFKLTLEFLEVIEDIVKLPLLTKLISLFAKTSNVFATISAEVEEIDPSEPK